MPKKLVREEIPQDHGKSQKCVLLATSAVADSTSSRFRRFSDKFFFSCAPESEGNFFSTK
jgi:hypothetical protein